jgi:uncharacterized protein YjiS (DUF1127 family)
MTTTLGERLRRSTVPERPAGMISGAIETLLHWHTLKRERRDLASLDDRMLHDIGLTRADVEFEFTKPFWRSGQ